mgnify:CR=1 FL=1
MLTINEAQLEAFQDISIEMFKSRMISFLTEFFFDAIENQSEFELKMFIANSIEKAEAFGIDTEDDVQAFIVYAVQLGINFDTKHSWAAKVLNNDNLLGSEKLEQLDLMIPTQYPTFVFHN